MAATPTGWLEPEKELKAARGRQRLRFAGLAGDSLLPQGPRQPGKETAHRYLAARV